MKKYRNIFILIAASVIAGCTETRDMEFDPIDTSVYTLVNADFKTFSDELHQWEADEAIGIFGSESGNNERYVIKEAGIGHTQASFYGPMVKGEIAGYWPYDHSYVAKADAMPFSLVNQQAYHEDAAKMLEDYSEKAFAYMTEGKKMEFYYPNSVLTLAFDFPEAVTVKGLRVESATSGLAGLGTVGSDGKVAAAESASRSVELSFEQLLLSETEEGLTEYSLIMMAGFYEDLKVVLEIVEDDMPIVWNLPKLELKRISVSDFKAETVMLKPSAGPDGFVEKDVVFDE